MKQTNKIPPDFIIIGAMKCGTSTLAAQLGAQTGVFMSHPKEPNYFSDDAVFGKGSDWYHGLFQLADAHELKGEASTHYTKLPTYPKTIERLKATGSRPKLIYMLRDPIDRLISHYIHEWTQGVITVSLEKAIKRHSELRSYSRYGEQLTPWVEEFGTEAILIVSMAELKKDPQLLLNKVTTFLGAPLGQWQKDLQKMNVSSDRVRRFPMHRMVFEHPVATSLRRTLVPQKLRDRIKKSRQMHNRPEMSGATREKLLQEFQEDREIFLKLFPHASNMKLLYPEPS